MQKIKSTRCHQIKKGSPEAGPTKTTKYAITKQVPGKICMMFKITYGNNPLLLYQINVK